MTSTRDRIAGAIFGGAVGDAMGNPTEFVGSFEAIRARWPPDGVTGFVEYRDRDGWQFAPYTDDTDMALVVLRTLLDGRDAGRDLEATMTGMAGAFVRWSKKPNLHELAPGMACLSGCRRLEQGHHWSEGGTPDSGGCGSIMRVYPFALVHMDDPGTALAWGVEHSKLTHRAPMALAACAGMTAGMLSLMGGNGPDAALEAMVLAAGEFDVDTAWLTRHAITEARAGTPPEGILDEIQGWNAREALAASAYVFARNPAEPARVILEGANSPGDSDSIACIAGSLAGAACGVDAIPVEWRVNVQDADELESLAVRITALHGA